MRIPPKLRSVRAILTLWYAVGLLAAFTLVGVSVYSYLRYEGERALERGLTAEVDWMANLLAVGLTPAEAIDTLRELTPEMRSRIEDHLAKVADRYTVLIRHPDGRLLYVSGDRSATELFGSPSVTGRTVLATIEQREGEEGFRVASLSHQRFELHVAVRRDNIERVLRNTLTIMFVLTPLGLVLSLGGGWALAGVALRPIGRIIDVANRRTVNNLQERIPERDVDDELGELIRTLNATADRMGGVFEQMRRFSADAAHELKTPLTILRGEAELALAGGITPDEAQRIASTFLEETVRMSALVDDMLTLAQAEAGTLRLAHDPVGVDALLEELYEDATILGSDKDLSIELLQNDPVTVMGDASRLRRLLRSLLANAVRYSERGGAIRIRSRRAGDRVRISLQDDGIGIPTDSLEKIFERFYRVDQARSRDLGGAGLGLPLARSIAAAHGGAI
ncbi:MAG TPA: ATP-binding protein, partial [Candidatus Polarisedimenticolia bacterium]|nr:ATP-binding protein [Candidatus Polarisedimenticolia bacterium]